MTTIHPSIHICRFVWTSVQNVLSATPPTSNYNLRSRVNFEVPFSRFCSYETSFIPSTLRLWNDIDIRRSSTLHEFKSKLRTQTNKVNDFFYQLAIESII